MRKQFYGKYRGQVLNNVDPQGLARIQVSVPAVLGQGRLSWAMPCVPYAGPGVGFFAIPPVGANVWVEFEGGDPDYPIWSGCFWGAVGEVPAQPAVPEVKIFKTEGVSLTLSDLPGEGGLTLETGPPVVELPLKLVMSATGLQIELADQPVTVNIQPESIELRNGSRSIVLAPTSVSINEGALEVM
jgi:hypothetical protein